MSRATRLVTTREIIAETFGAIVYRTRRTSEALAWLRPLRQSRVLVLEPQPADIENMLGDHDAGTLSYADASLGVACLDNGVSDVATEDAGFRSLRLTPVFSKRRR